MERLRLEVRDFAGPLRWRWLLMWDETGSVIDDHQVDISRAQDREEAAAFADLHGFLLWHAVPDRQEASEAEIIARVGAWAGREVLGRIGAAIARLAPVTVRVVVPAVAGFLASWPLELAHANGSPLAARGDVAFAYDLASGEDWLEATRPARDGRKPEMALRMLAVFSQPSATEVLAPLSAKLS